MHKNISLFILCFLFLQQNNIFSQTKFEKDFNEFWEDIHQNHAYLQQQNINWEAVKEYYMPKAKKIKSNIEFISFLEMVIYELQNGHISLNTNLDSSNKLVPTGQDMYVEKINDKFYITDLRQGFGAEKVGLKIGDEIISFNEKPIMSQLEAFLPKTTSHYTKNNYQYALDMLFAGTHNTKRKITIHKNNQEIHFYPDTSKLSFSKKLLDTKILNKNTIYIKINNSLTEFALIKEFDDIIDQYITYKNLIIDLTETSNGGNTTVARGIMGRFTEKTLPYQKHEFDEKNFDTKRSWIEYVSPRKNPYKGNVFVLVGHWTGSMGEGIAMGFDCMKRAKIIGTKMAGLLGAISGFSMSETKIQFQIPTERLYHINGTPREDFIPNILTKNTKETFDFIQKIK